MKNKMGLKEQVKSGELSPDEAIKKVKKSSPSSDNFLRWADGPGRKRYAQALKNKEGEEKTVLKKVPKKKSKKTE